MSVCFCRLKYVQVLHDASMFPLMVKCCMQVTGLCHVTGIAKLQDNVDTLFCIFFILFFYIRPNSIFHMVLLKLNCQVM